MRWPGKSGRRRRKDEAEEARRPPAEAFVPEQRQQESAPPPPPPDPAEAETLVDPVTSAPGEAPRGGGQKVERGFERHEQEPARVADQPPDPSLAARPLPESPTIGRVASSWQRRLAVTGWPRPGYAADGGLLGEFEILAASAIGQGHLHRGGPRQDAYQFAEARGGVVVAIADGVSAKPQAAIGAETAAFVAVRGFLAAEHAARGGKGSGEGPAEWLASGVEKADAAIRAAAREVELEPRALSTTLLAAHLSLGRDGVVTVATAAVGNSSALELVDEGPPQVISGPGAGDRSAYGEFLPGDLEAARASVSELSPEGVLVLATDGLAEDLHSSAAVRRWLWERLSTARTPIEFAHVLSYRRQGSSDDLTAVAIRAAPQR